MTLMIVGAVGSAFATRPRDYCEITPQYYRLDDLYFPAGQLGVNYICITWPSAVCTYFRPNPVQDPNGYAACRTGFYFQLLY